MNLNHLYILHLSNTGDDKTDKVCQQRYENLMIELANQGITDYTIIPGEYNPSNTKQAIHKGHRSIVQYAKDNGLERCIICEDDIQFVSEGAWNYFLSQIPQSYDIFSGLVYSASVENNRIMNGGSGLMSLFCVHKRHFDFFLSMDVNNHIDREACLTAYKHEYYVCHPQVVIQRGGYSFNLRQNMFYWPYMEGKDFYGKEGKKCLNGEWVDVL